MKRLLRWTLTKLQGEPPDAFTAFGRTVWFKPEAEVSPGLRAHEALHREQQKRDGAKFYAIYLWDYLQHGYRGVRYEIEAYELQDRVNRGEQ